MKSLSCIRYGGSTIGILQWIFEKVRNFLFFRTKSANICEKVGKHVFFERKSYDICRFSGQNHRKYAKTTVNNYFLSEKITNSTFFQPKSTKKWANKLVNNNCLKEKVTKNAFHRPTPAKICETVSIFYHFERTSHKFCVFPTQTSENMRTSR